MSGRAFRIVVIGLSVGVLFGGTLAVVTADAPGPSASRAGYRVPTAARLIAFDEIPTTTTTTTTTTTRPRPPAVDHGVFRVTCYGPPLFPAGQRTASGRPVGPGSIAVDPRVIRLGAVLEVEGYGRGVANDTGSKVRGRHVDVWVRDPSPCPWSRAVVRVVS